MLNPNELLYVVDEKNNAIDPLPRVVVHEKKLWHRTVHVWVVNNKKEILCQQRSLLKDIAPGNWDPFFGGHLPAHKSYDEGAIEELHEESGIQAEKDQLQFYKVVKDHTYHEFRGIFVYVWNGNLELLSFEENEIEQLKWIPLKKVLELIDGTVDGWSKVEYGKELLEKLSQLHR